MQDREKITKKTLPFDFILFKISLYFQGNTWPSKDRPVFTEQNPESNVGWSYLQRVEVIKSIWCNRNGIVQKQFANCLNNNRASCVKLLNGKNDICAALKDLKIKAVAPRRHYLGQKWLDIFFFPHFCPPFLAVSILMGFNFHIKQLEFTDIRASIFSWKWSITASKQVCFSFAWNCLRRIFVVLELSWMKTPGGTYYRPTTPHLRPPLLRKWG